MKVIYLLKGVRLFAKNENQITEKGHDCSTCRNLYLSNEKWECDIKNTDCGYKKCYTEKELSFFDKLLGRWENI